MRCAAGAAGMIIIYIITPGASKPGSFAPTSNAQWCSEYIQTHTQTHKHPLRICLFLFHTGDWPEDGSRTQSTHALPLTSRIYHQHHHQHHRGVRECRICGTARQPSPSQTSQLVMVGLMICSAYSRAANQTVCRAVIRRCLRHCRHLKWNIFCQ